MEKAQGNYIFSFEAFWIKVIHLSEPSALIPAISEGGLPSSANGFRVLKSPSGQ